MRPDKRRRSPQEKKSLSLARDRRNTYGQNDKAARKAIPKRKATANRKIRRIAKRALEFEGQEATDSALSTEMQTKWKKVPDSTLGDTLRTRIKRRRESHGAHIRRRIVREMERDDNSD